MLMRHSVIVLASLLACTVPLALAAGGGDHRCLGGPATGHWNLPSDHEPGFARGTLFLEGEDHPLLHLAAELRRTHAGQGVMEGVLHDVQHPDHGPRYVVLGEWVADDEGHGTFGAVIFRVHDGGHHRAGRIVGHFADPPGDDPHHDPAGLFHGEWRICRPQD